jgi:signal transduction histidine kinase
MKSSLGIGVLAAFMGAFLVLAGDALLACFNIGIITENEEQVGRTYELIAAVEKTLTLLEEAETGERGYVITGQRSFLRPYTYAVAHLDAQLERLKELAADNPHQIERIAALQEHVNAELAELQKTIALREPAGFEAAQAEELSGRGQQAMDAIRSVIADIENEETERLHERQAESRASWRRTIWTFVLSTLLGLALLALTCWLVHRDAAQRKRAADAAAQALRLKDEFLATLGHELRNPLVPLTSGLAVLKKPDSPAPLRQQMLGMMERQLRLLVRMVDDLLDVSRITRGQVSIHPELVKLADVVAHAVETIAPQMEARSQKLTLALPRQAVHLYADPARLVQVITNLLANSVKFTPPGGHIWLSAKQEPKAVTLRVRDNGAGIRPDLLPFVFDMFRQGDRTLARSEGGLGIGLTLVRRIVELHGGTVTAHSDGIDRGAEFVVRLPVRGAAAPAAA